MAINLVTKYSSKIEEGFALDSLVFGKGTAKYDWNGTDTVKSLSPTTVAPTDYDKTKTDGSRFGTPTEMEDVENTYTVTQDKSFYLTIDKGNNTSQLMIKASGRMMNKQVKEQITPMLDKYALAQYVGTTGVQAKVDGALTADNIFAAIVAARSAMVNGKVPTTGLMGWIRATDYGTLLQTGKIQYLQEIGSKAFSKGYVGTVGGINFIEVPDEYFATNINFLVAHPSVLMPVKKITTLRILTDDPLLDGASLQGRYKYDAFVLKQKVKGVYVSKNAASA